MADRYLRRARGRTGASGHARSPHLHTCGRSLGMPGRGRMCPLGHRVSMKHPRCPHVLQAMPTEMSTGPRTALVAALCAVVLASDPHAVLALRLERPSPSILSPPAQGRCQGGIPDAPSPPVPETVPVLGLPVSKDTGKIPSGLPSVHHPPLISLPIIVWAPCRGTELEACSIMPRRSASW